MKTGSLIETLLCVLYVWYGLLKSRSVDSERLLFGTQNFMISYPRVPEHCSYHIAE